MADDIAVDVGEAEAATLELVAELGVVDPQLMEDGGLQVVNVDGVLVIVMFVGMHFVAIGIDNLGAIFVGVPDGDASLDAATGHPHGEAGLVVIASVVGLAEGPLGVRRSSEFAAPDDEGVI